MTSFLGNAATARFELPSTDSPWQVAFGAPSKLGRCLSPRTFLAFRVLLALFWTGITIWSMVDHKANDLETAPEFYIYLTNWSLLIEWFYLVSATFVTRMALRNPKRTALDGAPSKTPLFARITYAAQVETYVLSFFVFVLYWALVYDGGTIHALSVFTHGVNFLVALADCLVAGIPMRLVQFWLPFVISSTYVIFSVVYDLAGGTADGDSYIYSVLDWSEDPGTAATYAVLVILVAFPVVFAACVFGVYPLRARCDCCPPAHPEHRRHCPTPLALPPARRELTPKLEAEPVAPGYAQPVAP